MRNPFLPYDTTYAHDRRERRHRCVMCSTLLQAGDQAVMARVGKGTKAAHLACADQEWKTHPGWTWRKQFEAWATSH